MCSVMEYTFLLAESALQCVVEECDRCCRRRNTRRGKHRVRVNRRKVMCVRGRPKYVVHCVTVVLSPII